MSDKFKAIVLDQTGEKFSREVKTLDKNFNKVKLENMCSNTKNDKLLCILLT